MHPSGCIGFEFSQVAFPGVRKIGHNTTNCPNLI